MPEQTCWRRQIAHEITMQLPTDMYNFENTTKRMYVTVVRASNSNQAILYVVPS